MHSPTSIVSSFSLPLVLFTFFLLFVDKNGDSVWLFQSYWMHQMFSFFCLLFSLLFDLRFVASSRNRYHWCRLAHTRAQVEINVTKPKKRLRHSLQWTHKCTMKWTFCPKQMSSIWMNQSLFFSFSGRIIWFLVRSFCRLRWLNCGDACVLHVSFHVIDA